LSALIPTDGTPLIHDFDIRMFATPVGAAYWYGAVYSAGFLGVFLWFWFRRRQVGMSARETFEFSILFAVGVLIGGRAFDILVYERDYYSAHPLAAFNWWAGGMASHGVLLGALACTLLFSGRKHVPALVLLDEVVVPGVFLLAVGRLGNFIEGGVIGTVTTMPWGFVYPDLVGPRHPVALYEAAKNFLILPVLVLALRRWPAGKGIVTALFVTLYAFLRFAVDLFRDYEGAWLGLGTGQVFNLVMGVSGLAMLVALAIWPRQPPAVRSPGHEPVGIWRPVLFAMLLIYPLGIPTSWTHANIVAKRSSVSAEPDRSTP
jgi:phosphatidylglycerol:prolipoprotein diacylglycerol transferase